MATLKQINHLADVNATDNLHKIMRLPDYVIHKWKDVACDLRERGENPSLEYISENSSGDVSKPNLTRIFGTLTAPIPKEIPKGH